MLLPKMLTSNDLIWPYEGSVKKELDQEQPQLLWSWVDQTMSMSIMEKKHFNTLLLTYRWCWGHKTWPKAQTSNKRYVIVTDITSQGLFVRSHHSLWVSSHSVIHHGLGKTTKLPKLPLKVTPRIPDLRWPGVETPRQRWKLMVQWVRQNYFTLYIK